MAIRSSSPPPPYDGRSEEEESTEGGRHGHTPKDSVDSTGVKAGKALGKGLLTLVAIPFALTGVAVVAAGGVIWGAAKVVEGVGKGLAAGSEAAARAAMGSVEAPESRESGEARTSETASERKKKGVRRKGKGKSEK
ncbi:hypothetical protein C8Q70DRAFT_1051779 [Cubamyces menziesii]|nr:hypothetical protein C8Q70DRAFT_1051779 [Cubamyces menziesii]